MAHGNGDAATCVANLARTVRGTVPMERFKGVDGTVIDRPASDLAPVRVAVAEVVRAYEPRVSPRDVRVAMDGGPGDFALAVEIGGA